MPTNPLLSDILRQRAEEARLNMLGYVPPQNASGMRVGIGGDYIIDNPLMAQGAARSPLSVYGIPGVERVQSEAPLAAMLDRAQGANVSGAFHGAGAAAMPFVLPLLGIMGPSFYKQAIGQMTTRQALTNPTVLGGALTNALATIMGVIPYQGDEPLAQSFRNPPLK